MNKFASATLLLSLMAGAPEVYATAEEDGQTVEPAFNKQKEAAGSAKNRNPEHKCRMEQAAGTRSMKRVCRGADSAQELRKSGREFLETGQRRLQDVKATGD